MTNQTGFISQRFLLHSMLSVSRKLEANKSISTFEESSLKARILPQQHGTVFQYLWSALTRSTQWIIWFVHQKNHFTMANVESITIIGHTVLVSRYPWQIKFVILITCLAVDSCVAINTITSVVVDQVIAGGSIQTRVTGTFIEIWKPMDITGRC